MSGDIKPAGEVAVRDTQATTESLPKSDDVFWRQLSQDVSAATQSLSDSRDGATRTNTGFIKSSSPDARLLPSAKVGFDGIEFGASAPQDKGIKSSAPDRESDTVGAYRDVVPNRAQGSEPMDQASRAVLGGERCPSKPGDGVEQPEIKRKADGTFVMQALGQVKNETFVKTQDFQRMFDVTTNPSNWVKWHPVTDHVAAVPDAGKPGGVKNAIDRPLNVGDRVVEYFYPVDKNGKVVKQMPDGKSTLNHVDWTVAEKETDSKTGEGKYTLLSKKENDMQARISYTWKPGTGEHQGQTQFTRQLDILSLPKSMQTPEFLKSTVDGNKIVSQVAVDNLEKLIDKKTPVAGEKENKPAGGEKQDKPASGKMQDQSVSGEQQGTPDGGNRKKPADPTVSPVKFSQDDGKETADELMKENKFSEATVGGVVMANNGRLRDALTLFKAGLKDYQDNPFETSHIDYFMATTYRTLKEPENALVVTKKGIETLAKADGFDSAPQMRLLAAGLHEERAAAFGTTGKIEDSMNEYAAAMYMYQSAQKLSPDTFHDAAADYLKCLRQYQQAVFDHRKPDADKDLMMYLSREAESLSRYFKLSEKRR